MTDVIVKGFKATDKNMQCRGFQFELGVWHKHNGEIAMCESGFHFCEYPSGPWSFYSNEGTRIFKVEARGVIKGEGPGADLKHVAMEIRLIEEILFTGGRNTGDRNTGYGNTGDRNTGDGNTGDRNTGYGNTGNRNTGNGNTGYGNTGYGNATDKCPGYLSCKKQPIIIFDKKVKDGVEIDWSLVHRLSDLMMSDESIDCSPFLSIPNSSEAAIKKLHKAHIDRRKANK